MEKSFDISKIRGGDDDSARKNNLDLSTDESKEYM